jgi:hypothetical protein
MQDVWMCTLWFSNMEHWNIMAQVGHTSWSRTCSDECTGVLPCAGVCAILALQGRIVKTSTSHAIPHPVSMMGNAWRWIPWATNVGAPQVSACNHQHYHDHGDCEYVEWSFLQVLHVTGPVYAVTCLLSFLPMECVTWTHDGEDSSIHPCVLSVRLLIRFWSDLSTRNTVQQI